MGFIDEINKRGAVYNGYDFCLKDLETFLKKLEEQGREDRSDVKYIITPEEQRLLNEGTHKLIPLGMFSNQYVVVTVETWNNINKKGL